ncbi:MAG: hypothetical protein ACK559_33130, partial [bacterium]
TRRVQSAEYSEIQGERRIFNNIGRVQSAEYSVLQGECRENIQEYQEGAERRNFSNTRRVQIAEFQ